MISYLPDDDTPLTAAFAALLDYRLGQAAHLADALEALRDAVLAEGLAAQAPVRRRG